MLKYDYHMYIPLVAAQSGYMHPSVDVFSVRLCNDWLQDPGPRDPAAPPL